MAETSDFFPVLIALSVVHDIHQGAGEQSKEVESLRHLFGNANMAYYYRCDAPKSFSIYMSL
jgi:hypothetical protein